jgi:coenzyme F420-0:L-glutamate ligase/coenzyme F420-1:gamma-L-glutamate ligase
MATAVSIIGLERIGLIKPGDDLSRIILESATSENIQFADNDVIVISQKIVSKAEGQLVNIEEIKPGRRAQAYAKKAKKDPRLVELILRDASRVLRAERRAFVVRRKDGLVCLNAGVDKSNVNGKKTYALLPKNSDYSAQVLRSSLERLTGKQLAVIVTDTYSRPSRVGQAEFAIGIAGIEPIVDYRGKKDLFGYELRYKYVGLADEVAAAAELVKGQGTEGIPVAIVRGLPRLTRTEEKDLSKKLLIGRQTDLFTRLV